MFGKDQKIKFAVVGAGHIGKRHAEMIRREEEAELVALVDVRSAEECEATHFEVPMFKTVEELITGLSFTGVNVTVTVPDALERVSASIAV